MKKTYLMENLDCANCAAKMEAKFNAHPQVQQATVTFATRQLRLTAEDPDSLIPELTAIARTVESQVRILPRESGDAGHTCSCDHHHDHGCGHHDDHDHSCGCGHHGDHDHTCGCGHHDDHDHGCGCGHDHGHHTHSDGARELRSLVLGGGLFVLGLVLSHLGQDLLSLAVCLVCYVLLGRQVLATAAKNLVGGHLFDENFLMSLATLGAFCIGEYPEAVGVMLFYRVGQFFEHRAVERSRGQIMAAVDLRPETVNLLDGQQLRQIPAEQARVGDLLLVRPGDRIPLDGTVVSGQSRVDTAPITGEPVPVSVHPGSALISGCVNTTSQLTVRVDKVLSESMVTRILDCVENAAASKPRIDRFITRFSRVYTPAVVAIASATALIPSLVTGNWSYWVYTALSFLVMSCPCALVLSVPLAFFAGIGTGSREGILFKGGQSMEAMGQVKAVVMDKTGTLTQGDFRVRTVAGGHDVLQLCASCEQTSTHPIAQSIVACARERGMALTNPESLEEFSGRGIRAVMGGRVILCGNEQLLTEHGVKMQTLDPVAGTRVLVAEEGSFIGYILVSDTLKSDAGDAVRQLKRRGIAAVMLTGDAGDTAAAVARELELDGCYARLLPQDKLTRLRQLRQKYGPVMYVGDGINDAPVLAGADVGCAMGSGADAAIEAADVVFLTSDMAAVPRALEIAAKTAGIAWQNVIFALAVKGAVMILGLMGFASMWLAVFADSGVAMLCVLNSIRMLYGKSRKRK